MAWRTRPEVARPDEAPAEASCPPARGLSSLGPPAGGGTLVELLLARAREGARPAATHRVSGRWVDVSWGEVLERVRRLSAGLVARGVRPGDRVALFSATRLQWLVCDLAISAAQAVTVPLYPSSTPEECRALLAQSGAVLLFVDGEEAEGAQVGRLSRIRQRRAECPALRTVVVFDGAAVRPGAGELSLAALEALGAAADEAQPSAFPQRVAALGAEDACCLLYTSGTTGEARGVVLTHGNWTYEAQALSALEVVRPEDRVLLFLPLAHAFAQGVKAAWLATGFTLAFAESPDRLLADLAEVRPTLVPAVPRLLEKLYAGVRLGATRAGGLTGLLARWAFRQFDAEVEARLQHRPTSSPAFVLARRLLQARVRPALEAQLGGRVRQFVCGGAPLARKLGFFFALMGTPVVEGYGLTESSGGATLNPPGRVKVGTVGPPLPGTEVRIAPDGEVLLRGPGVMRGYHDNPRATAEVLEPDGWLHTGDIGELDADGSLRLTDRKKDILVTAGGKNVAPQALESALKTFPLVSQAMVAGDRRPYLVALVCVAEEAGRALLAERGVQVEGYADVARHPLVRAAVADVVAQVNATLPSYATLKAFALMDHDFTQESGELTPTLKVRRKACTQRYQALLDGLYEGQPPLD